MREATKETAKNPIILDASQLQLYQTETAFLGGIYRIMYFMQLFLLSYRME